MVLQRQIQNVRPKMVGKLVVTKVHFSLSTRFKVQRELAGLRWLIRPYKTLVPGDSGAVPP